MDISVYIPSLGLDRTQRAQGPDPEAVNPAPRDGDSDQTIAPNRVAPNDGAGLPGETRSGLGDGARANLLRSTGEDGPLQQDKELSPDGLTKEQQAQVKELKARDREVRNHEEAHARVGGQYAGQPSYTYQTGPDGKRYAIGGEVPIDVAPIPDDPKATIAKMDVVIAAALAPAEPSGQDRKVAALASRQRVEATADLAAERAEALKANEPSLPGTLNAIDTAGETPSFDLAA